MSHSYRNSDRTGAVDRARRLGTGVLRANARAADQQGCFPQLSVQALASNGLLGLTVGPEFGGAGEGMRAFAAATEALAEGCGSTAMIFVMHVAATEAIAASATLSRKVDVLGAIASGVHLTTLAFSERGSRSQFWAPVSELKEGDGGFTVAALKSFVTSAGHADSYVSSARMPNARSSLESTLFLVTRPNDKVRIQGAFDGLGLRGNESSPVAFDEMFVSPGDLLTPQGKGADAMLQVVLPWFSIGTAAMANGLCRAAVSATADHLQRTTFAHTGSGLRDIPTLRARLADMSVRTEQAAALLGRTIDLIEEGADTALLFVLQTRLASIEAALDVTDLAMKACGGAAFSKHLDVERLFRDARAGWVMAPTADHLREFVGRALTGLPLF
jgi:alkylation response protein AidB-like acyl-CoA dehydrogenase